MHANERTASPLEDWTDTPLGGGNRFLVKRDDLLPFPLAGNKVRKLTAELSDINVEETILVTVGAITSNHCRTTAMLAAQRGGRTHLILHGDPTSSSAELALTLLGQLGATWKVVDPPEIEREVKSFLANNSTNSHFIAGGCHTVAGVQAYSQAVVELSLQTLEPPDLIVLASGTGATQAGVIAGCRAVGWHQTTVLGVSVARLEERGLPAIKEALRWVNCSDENLSFTDTYCAGGYGQYNGGTLRAVREAWLSGLPADTTYTGKALHAWCDIRDSGSAPETTVFWHTGGLATHLYYHLDELS